MPSSSQLDFFTPAAKPALATPRHSAHADFAAELRAFREFRTPTQETATAGIPTFINEFWTAKQRAAHSLHEISYRACFKPQLPRFFIERLTAPGDRVYDPFMGRGTTLLEAALLGRRAAGCDVNPLSAVLTQPRLNPPPQSEVEKRLAQIDFTYAGEIREDLLAFYHPATLRQITALKNHFLNHDLDPIDQWIRMVAINRLTGHSPGFFSVYTMPPNQAVSIKSQIKINQRRNQTPPERNIPKIIAKKSRQLLGDLTDSQRPALKSSAPVLLTGPSHQTPVLENNSISLVVTSPPFLDIVDYAGDNWLRCWFLGIDPAQIQITTPKKIDAWREAMTAIFRELHRVLRPGGHIAFEVGEVRKGTVRLEEVVLQSGADARLTPRLILINDQEFTKTANCWGVNNNTAGTNTNRIVLFQKS